MDFDCNVMHAAWLPRTAMRFHQNRPSALYSYTMTENRKDKPKLYLGWHIVVGVGGSLGPLAGGLIYDATGSYRYAWWRVLVSPAGAIAGIVSMKRHA